MSISESFKTIWELPESDVARARLKEGAAQLLGAGAMIGVGVGLSKAIPGNLDNLIIGIPAVVGSIWPGAKGFANIQNGLIDFANISEEFEKRNIQQRYEDFGDQATD